VIDIAAREVLAGERPLQALLDAMIRARAETAAALRDGRIQ
jgi:hypothetical protein